MAMGGGGGGSPGMANAIRAGAAYVELFLKDNALLRGLNFWKEQLGKMGKVMAAVGTAALGGIGLLGGTALAVLYPVVETLGELRRMDDAGKALGLTARAASGLFGVLGQYSDLGENVEGLTQFAQKVQDAVNGVGGVGGEAAKLFDGLSVSAAELMSLPLDEKFYRIHAAIRELPQAQQQFKLSMLGGTDSMKKWLPLLSLSNEELRRQATAMQFSSTELDQASRSSSAYTRAIGALHRAWQQVAVAVAPVVEQLAVAVEKVARWFVEWVKGRDAANLFAEVWTRVKIGLFEVQAWSEDVFGAVWDYFADNAESAMEVVKKLFTGLFQFAAGSFAKIFPIWTKQLAIGVAATMGTMATLMKTVGLTKEGDELFEQAKQIDPAREAKRVAELQAEGEKELAEALKGFEEERKKFAAALLMKQGNMGLAAFVGGPLGVIAAGREGERVGQRRELQQELDAVNDVAERQRNTAAFREFMNELQSAVPGERVLGDPAGILAQAGKGLGTFAAGPFFGRAYGVQSADSPEKKLIEETKKQTGLLGKIEGHLAKNGNGLPVITE